LELPAKLSSKPNITFISGSGNSRATAAASTSGSASTAGAAAAAAGGDEVHMALNQDLVAAMVKLEGMTRRLEMAEREKDRINASLSEAQVGAFAYIDAAKTAWSWLIASCHQCSAAGTVASLILCAPIQQDQMHLRADSVIE
jgi:hypothetical protein